jgi:hypothetical protein
MSAGRRAAVACLLALPPDHRAHRDGTAADALHPQTLVSYLDIGAADATASNWRLSWRNTLGPWLGAALIVPLCLALVPLVGLLLPWTTGSAVCHLVPRSRGQFAPPLHVSEKVQSTGPEFIR